MRLALRLVVAVAVIAWVLVMLAAGVLFVIVAGHVALLVLGFSQTYRQDAGLLGGFAFGLQILALAAVVVMGLRYTLPPLWRDTVVPLADTIERWYRKGNA